MERDPKKTPKEILEEAYSEAIRRKAPALGPVSVSFEKPRQPEHGDWATSFALQYAKAAGRKPREFASSVSAEAMVIIRTIFGDNFTEEPRIEGPGFANHRLRPAAHQQIIKRVLEEGTQFGHTKAARPEKVMIEFVSANPTGPLHVGHGRQAALGDALAALLESQGHQVTREF
jgi:arginyl-tRNA synthetase